MSYYTCHEENGLDSPETKVIMVLVRELAARQMVQGDNLGGQILGGEEAEREENDLGDEVEVGHHHGHGPVQRLQVVRQLDAARIGRIHCDEDAAGGVQLDVAALEQEAGQQRVLGRLDRQHLLRHHRQHLSHNHIDHYLANCNV